MFASFQGNLLFIFTYCAFHSKNDLLGGLCLLVEHRLGLSTVTGLFSVVTTFTLCKKRSLSGLVLSDLVGGVLLALLPLAVGTSGFGNIDHGEVVQGAEMSSSSWGAGQIGRASCRERV